MPKIKTAEELVEMQIQRKLMRHQKSLDMISVRMSHKLALVKEAKENKNNITSLLLDLTQAPAPALGP